MKQENKNYMRGLIAFGIFNLILTTTVFYRLNILRINLIFTTVIPFLVCLTWLLFKE